MVHGIEIKWIPSKLKKNEAAIFKELKVERLNSAIDWKVFLERKKYSFLIGYETTIIAYDFPSAG